MLTLKEYRRTRLISQREAAQLAGVALMTIKRHDNKRGNAESNFLAWDIENELEHGPHGFIRSRPLHPLILTPMTWKERMKLKAGESFCSLEYFEPSDLRMSVLRPDLIALYHQNKGKRVIVHYSVIHSRYEREQLRKGYGVKVVDIYLPKFPSLPLTEKIA